MQNNGRWPLFFSAVVILAASLLHVAALFAGPGFVAQLGAPQEIVESAAQGTALAPVTICAIALVLLLVGVSALSTAGTIRPLPLSRPVLHVTAAVLFIRAAALPLIATMYPVLRARINLFEVATALLCFLLAGLFWIGLRNTRPVR